MCQAAEGATVVSPSARRAVHASILANAVVAAMMAMITSGNGADAGCGRLPENGGSGVFEEEEACYLDAACHASAVSCA
jgi:hypothetical protein